MNKRNILLLGCGQDQLIGIQKCLELGLGVYAFDGNPEAVGKKYVDGFECLDIKSPDEVEKAALKLNKKVGIDGCIALGVEVGRSVGRVVDRLGLRGIGEELADKLTDKILRRKLLDELKIPQPKWAYREEKRAGLWNTFPCVVKPRDKAGAKGVRLVNSFAEVGLNYDMLEEYLDNCWELSVEVICL